jgi:hypothetical protein
MEKIWAKNYYIVSKDASDVAEDSERMDDWKESVMKKKRLKKTWGQLNGENHWARRAFSHVQE